MVDREFKVEFVNEIQRAFPAISQLLKDGDKFVRLSGAQALEKLSKQGKSDSG